MFLKNAPQHLHERLKQKTVKSDIDLMKEIPYIDIGVSFTSRDHEDKIIDHIIKNLPAGNSRYYNEYEKVANTFKILEDLPQTDLLN